MPRLDDCWGWGPAAGPGVLGSRSNETMLFRNGQLAASRLASLGGAFHGAVD
jgi:hypothetical protein